MVFTSSFSAKRFFIMGPNCQNLGMSLLNGKKAKIDNKKLTAIEEYLLCRNCLPLKTFLFRSQKTMTLNLK